MQLLRDICRYNALYLFVSCLFFFLKACWLACMDTCICQASYIFVHVCFPRKVRVHWCHHCWYVSTWLLLWFLWACLSGESIIFFMIIEEHVGNSPQLTEAATVHLHRGCVTSSMPVLVWSAASDIHHVESPLIVHMYIKKIWGVDLIYVFSLWELCSQGFVTRTFEKESRQKKEV